MRKNNIVPKNYITVNIKEDKTNFIKNPYMGWVVYVEYSCSLHNININKENENLKVNAKICIDINYPEKFFKKLDEEIEKGLRPSILYLRMGWQWFEPQKKEYSWRNPNSNISKYIEGAKKRKMQIAFRILVSDESPYLSIIYNEFKLTVPYWLYNEDGIKTYKNQEGSRTPYYDNEIYLYYYENLIRELSKDFNNPDLVAFIDAQGLGMWGEMHDIRTSGRLSLQETLEEHSKIWTTYFTKVLLGATFGGGVDLINEKIIVPKYNYMIRRDAFGSKWLGDFTKTYLEKFFINKIPLYAEVAYWHLKNKNYIEEYFPKDDGINKVDIRTYLEYALKQAQLCRANTLDFRVPSDWSEWSEKGLDLADKFCLENGYRLVLTNFYYPKHISKNVDFKIFHNWKNIGLGFLPIHNNQLKNKYKISFALLDENNIVVYQYIDYNIEPSWIKEDNVVKEVTTLNIPINLECKEYKFGIAIIDTNTNKPAINLAINDLEIIPNKVIINNPQTWYGSWYILGNIIIN